jgi:ABC-type spermidine/putrescine transport system permease subunit II
VGEVDGSALVPGAVVLLLIACPIVGFVARHWSTLLLPAVSWPLLFVGWDRKWWIGEGLVADWHSAAALMTVIGIVSTVAAVGLGKLVARHRGGIEHRAED